MAYTRITVFGCGEDEAALFRGMAPRFGVLPTITDAPVSHANIELAAGTRCISVGHKSRISNSLLRALRQAGISYISTRSIGYNHIDVTFAERIGIAVENVTYSCDSVADYTVMLMLMAARHAKTMINRVQHYDFRVDGIGGKELRDMTVGVIGTGRIGAAVINRLRGFGSNIIAYDCSPTSAATYVSLDALVQQSDMVTLHTPLNAQTYHLLDRHRLRQMKPGAFLINTGRGGLVDTEALIDALECGQLGGAALDVLEGEEGIFYEDCRHKPMDQTLVARLQKLPNVLITPHTAYYTDHALSDMVEQTLRNCGRYERSTPHE
ncbi:MAG: lactate dehydrogenase [Sulfobacillus acidophilus]|uniref:Lactate dehydrogenase n=1 Tax=Sulfobacillus acidophilus TaxID=53633 RepID=A0A2T2WDC2_9FIRM|nr:MAG: lactate dehydrogenase [Sulfobacillus acidophilus]